MTGFGKATAEFPTKKITVEVKSLNSKQLDLSARIPSIYKEQELNIRGLIARRLERGKIDFAIYVENTGKETTSQVNQNVLESYYNQIKESSDRLGIALPSDWFQVLLRLPDALKYEAQEADEEEWKMVLETVNKALDQLVEFRKQEGAMLEDLFKQKINNIAASLSDIGQFESERIEKVKTRITEALEKIENFDYDKNRFEQEMIFYIEKLDINEEKSRLANHLKYFLETLENGQGQGKKLGFISQEIGREVNTMGSKANHAQMQQVVVIMKDELEQIKEQVLNVL